MGRGGDSTAGTTASRHERKPADAERIFGATATAATRGRPNEDRYLIDESRGVIAVFDGIGGGGGGADAAEAARQAFASGLAEIPAADQINEMTSWLRDVMKRAGYAVREVRRNFRQGTTGCALALCGDVAIVCSIGDSRAYRLSVGGELERLSFDDTAFASLTPDAAAAQLLCDQASTPEDLRVGGSLVGKMFKSRNIISADLASAADQEHSVDGATVEAGDLLFVCSDGIHDNLTSDEIADLARAHRGSAADLSQALILAAQRRAADSEHMRAKDDDMTCCALRV